MRLPPVVEQSVSTFKLQPLSNLPFPKFQNAVNEIQAKPNFPIWLVIPTCLSAIAVSSQWQIKVKMPEILGGVKSPSMIIIVGGLTGEGKSPISGFAFKAIHNFRKEQDAEYEKLLMEWDHEHKIWGDELTAYRQAKKGLIRKLEVVPEDLELKIREMLKAEPPKPKRIKVIYEDTTSAACFNGLHVDFPSAILMSSEAGIVIKSQMLSEFAKLNALYSNEGVTVDRMNRDSYTLNALLSVFLMVQPILLDKLIEKKGDELRHSGFFPRGLYFDGDTTQGNRHSENFTVHTEHIDIFNARIKQLLDEMVQAYKDPGFTPQIIEFSKEASEHLIGYKNWLDSQLNPGGYYEKANDLVAKLPENIARVAVLLHHFEGYTGDISICTLKGAITICEYSSNSYLNKFVPPPQVEVDAEILTDWLRKYRSPSYRYRYFYIPRLGNYGPNSLRNEKKRLIAAAELLCERGLINIIFWCNKQLIDIYPENPPIDPREYGVTFW